MKTPILALFCCLLSFGLAAQVPADYFQQDVAYTIQVELDDIEHRLSGTADILYRNNAPEALGEIYIHLWPNAYKNDRTALARQFLENGNLSFHFAEDEALGGYEDIDVKLNGKVAQWNYWDGHPDVILMKLPKALPPGESVTINTRFVLDIPEGSISRLGHIGESYQMTQWYPKPAVYDRNGWHPMPYLGQGEFYSEFGAFDVEITLPENYVVAATGELQTESERAFIERKIADTGSFSETDTFPASSNARKTIRFSAERVHDFAWFADKRFRVRKGKAALVSGAREVDTYVYFTNHQSDWWESAIGYVNQSVGFYSEKVGDYPYPHATAIQSPFSAGAGMEYPMITIIGTEASPESLDEVITHEVGHNWFYGILGSNERDHAWMDEGFNSYYEQAYMARHYPGEEKKPWGDMSELLHGDVDQLSFRIPMMRHTEQPVDVPSQDLTYYNYWTSAYDRPAYLLYYLMHYLGEDAFDKAIHHYYDTWKFKHPQPRDVKAVFEQSTGKDLGWFFDDLIGAMKKLDYKVKGIRKDGDAYEVTVQNKGGVAAPFSLDALRDGEIVETVWQEGFEGERTVRIHSAVAERFVLDGRYLMPEYNRRNNTIKAKGGKMEPLAFRFLGGADNPQRTEVYYAPLLGFNTQDGFMLGAAFYNTVAPNKHFEWSLAPMYGFQSKRLAGFGDMKYHLYPKKIQRLTLGVGYKRFSYHELGEYYDPFDESPTLMYDRLSPGVELELKKKRARSPVRQRLKLEVLALRREETGESGFDDNGNPTYAGHGHRWYYIPRLSYDWQRKTALHPSALRVELEQFRDDGFVLLEYVKLTAEAKQKIHYGRGKAVHLRFYGGVFLNHSRGFVDTRRLGSLSLFSSGQHDNWFDRMYMGRGAGAQFVNQQIHGMNGGLKWNTQASSSSFGVSNNSVFSLNLKLDLPMDFPDYIPDIRPYMDMGVYKDQGVDLGDNFLVSAGLAVELYDMLGLYFPIWDNKNLKDVVKGQKGKYGARVAFKIDLDRLNILKSFNRQGL